MQNDKPDVKLEDWAVLSTQDGGAYQNLTPGTRVVGRAFGHPGVADGMFILSSTVLRCGRNEDRVETRNTHYSLGRPSVEYEKWAREHQEVYAA